MVGEKWSYLCGVSQDYEADIIIGLLHQESIPAIKQYPEAGAFLKIAYGLTTGVNLYVPNDSRLVALQLIQESLNQPLDNVAVLDELNVQETEAMDTASASASIKPSHVPLWVILLTVLLLVIVLVYNSHPSW